jgi:hypothetical protein
MKPSRLLVTNTFKKRLESLVDIFIHVRIELRLLVITLSPVVQRSVDL